MKKEKTLQIIGIAVFLIVTLLTYGVVTPVSETKTSQDLEKSKVTNTTTNTTNISEDSNIRLENNYRIMTAIAAGAVLSIIIVFLIGFW